MIEKKAGSDIYLRIIAIFKLAHALFFFAAAVGILHLWNKDVEAWLLNVMNNLHVDADNHLARKCLEKAGQLTNTKVASLSAIAFCYGCLFATEGMGLYLKKRWAEYLVVVITGSLLPLEIYELFVSLSWPKVLLIIGNLAILGYLIYVIMSKKKQENNPS